MLKVQQEPCKKNDELPQVRLRRPLFSSPANAYYLAWPNLSAPEEDEEEEVD